MTEPTTRKPYRGIAVGDLVECRQGTGRVEHVADFHCIIETHGDARFVKVNDGNFIQSQDPNADPTILDREITAGKFHRRGMDWVRPKDVT